MIDLFYTNKEHTGVNTWRKYEKKYYIQQDRKGLFKFWLEKVYYATNQSR